MNTQTQADVPALDPLHHELRELIATSRVRVASTVNAELSRLYWAVGQRLCAEALGGERARYGARLMEQLGERLAAEFGRGLKPRTCAAWSSSPRRSHRPGLSRRCRDN